MPELLLFVIQNDALFDYAVGQSARGFTLTPCKMGKLENYEFELPELNEADSQGELLKAAYQTKKCISELIKANWMIL